MGGVGDDGGRGAYGWSVARGPVPCREPRSSLGLLGRPLSSGVADRLVSLPDDAVPRSGLADRRCLSPPRLAPAGGGDGSGNRAHAVRGAGPAHSATDAAGGGTGRGGDGSLRGVARGGQVGGAWDAGDAPAF